MNFKPYKNGLQKCNHCGLLIPSNIPRLTLTCKIHYGRSQTRICGKCILKLSKEINIKDITEWEKKIMEKEL